MPKYKDSEWKDKKHLKEKPNRQGSLLDFIQGFLNEMPATIDTIEGLLTETEFETVKC